MIRTRSIFEEPAVEDGIRYCVMSRLTKNDGVTPDPRIRGFNEWRKEFAPPEKLVGAYYRGEVSWEEFSREYRSYLRTPSMIPQVRALAKEGLEKTITILCVEEEPLFCHRWDLTEECLRYEPLLVVEHYVRGVLFARRERAMRDKG